MPARLLPGLLSLLTWSVLGGGILFFAKAWAWVAPKAPPYQPITFSAAKFPQTITDAMGREVVVEQAPQRLVTTIPSMTQITCVVGAHEKLVGVTSIDPIYSTQYQDLWGHATTINYWPMPDVETVLRQDPDLLLTLAHHGDNIVPQLERLGIPSVIFSHQSLDETIEDILRLGQATGHRQDGEQARAQARTRLELVREGIVSKPDQTRPRALIFTHVQGGSAAAPGSYIGDLLAEAGAVNLAGQTGLPWPALSLEWIVRENPEVIFTTSVRTGEALEVARQELLQELRADPIWRHVKAVQTGEVHIIGGGRALIPGPALLDAVESIAHRLDPDRFAVPQWERETG